jgi:transcription elongation factor Elf1
MTNDPNTPDEVTVECMRCGALRHVDARQHSRFPECSVCGYAGWVEIGEIQEEDRRDIGQTLDLRERASSARG